MKTLSLVLVSGSTSFQTPVPIPGADAFSSSPAYSTFPKPLNTTSTSHPAASATVSGVTGGRIVAFTGAAANHNVQTILAIAMPGSLLLFLL